MGLAAKKTPAFGVNDQARLNLDLSATVGSRIMNSYVAQLFYFTFKITNNQYAHHDQTVQMRKFVCAFVILMQQNQDFAQWGPIQMRCVLAFFLLSEY